VMFMVGLYPAPILDIINSGTLAILGG